MKIIAHRGASGSERENTADAFRAAYEMDANAIETDVRRCPECWKLKLSHDPIVSEEDCERIADFSEILSFGEKMELVLELKEKGIYKEVAAITDNLRFRDKITFSSFLWDELFKMGLTGRKKHFGLLWEGGEKISVSLVFFAAKIIGAKSVHIDFSSVKKNEGIVKYFRERGLEVWAYTLNSESELEAAKKLNVDGIFTDYPAYAFYLIYGKTGD